MAKAKKLKLYIWTGVLKDWKSGVAFALAESPELAVEEVKKAGLDYSDGWNGVKLDGQEPKEYSEPFGFYLYGSS